MSIKNSAPCKDCPDSGCGRHSDCEKYLEWKAEWDKKKNSIMGEQKRERMLNEFSVDGYRKVSKMIGRKQ